VLQHRVETSSFGEDKGTIAGSNARRKDLKQQKCIRPALSKSRFSPVFLGLSDLQDQVGTPWAMILKTA